MSLRDRINQDVKAAMKAGDAQRRDTLRLVAAELQRAALDHGEAGYELTEDEVLKVLNKAVKSRTDSAEQYASAGRAELEAKERAEIAVIQEYLPQPLTEDELTAIVKTAIADTGASSKADMGKVMKAVMAASQGRADGKLVSRLVGSLLG